MAEREAEAVSGRKTNAESQTKTKKRSKEVVYREQMQALGIYEEIFEPEIQTLARVERELTRAEKAWSATAAPGGKPSFLDPHYAIIQRIRAEVSQHREALGLTPKALRKLTGAAGVEAPEQKDLITAKLDRIAERVAGYDLAPGESPELGLYIEGEQGPELVVSRNNTDGRTRFGGVDQQPMGADPRQDPFAGIPEADEAAAISDIMDRQDAAEDINERLAKGVGPGPRGEICPAADRPWYAEDYDLAAAVAEDMG